MKTSLVKSITIDDGSNHLKVQYSTVEGLKNVTYIILPMDIDDDQLNEWIQKSQSNIVIIEGMDWDNDLTPWPAPGQPKGSPNFKGLAPEFLNTLITKVMPKVEGELALENPSRNLIGISLSGLFGLWACIDKGQGVFHNLCSLSGSFWYQDFTKWVEQNAKEGKIDPKKFANAFFSLGNQEPLSKNKVFATVGTNTEEIISILNGEGVNCELQWYQGNHYSPIGPRLSAAFDFLSKLSD